MITFPTFRYIPLLLIVLLWISPDYTTLLNLFKFSVMLCKLTAEMAPRSEKKKSEGVFEW